MRRQKGLLVRPLMISLCIQVLILIILRVNWGPMLVSPSPISLPWGVRRVVPLASTMLKYLVYAHTLMANLVQPVIWWWWDSGWATGIIGRWVGLPQCLAPCVPGLGVTRSSIMSYTVLSLVITALRAAGTCLSWWAGSLTAISSQQY